MAKQYKPGQFVSICGKLCRVKRAVHPCYKCTLVINCANPEFSTECIRKLGMHNYPEPIKPE